ncbi:MAG: hypothetical protein JHC81_09485 [Brevundimonas sp.]|uniref:hypothetical protein n=1 Tax=Brevundimonas sp. TaxID=1871086 RepID=UPI001A3025B4|nr:hypothetical protein [Brevundimonas sp.]MBJ7447753.1 hypothetical protein [Brevundimonas sp.]
MIQIALLALALSDSSLQAPPPAPPLQARLPTGRIAPPPIEPWEWIEPPLPLFPLEALIRDTTTGTVRTTCRTVSAEGILSNCEILSERPEGQGFGAEQLTGMPTGRLSPDGIARFQREGSVTFTTYFRSPDGGVRDREGRIPEDLPPRRRLGTTSFVFDGQAGSAVMSWDTPPNITIPDRAINRDVRDGFAVVVCSRVSEARVLSGCQVVQESHLNVGLGQAVLNALPAARTSEETAESVRQGNRAMFRIRFGLR